MVDCAALNFVLLWQIYKDTGTISLDYFFLKNYLTLVFLGLPPNNFFDGLSKNFLNFFLVDSQCSSLRFTVEFNKSAAFCLASSCDWFAGELHS